MTEPRTGRARLIAGMGSAARVTASQLSLAGASYVVLAVGGRALDARGFAAVTAFYLLVNTVGRGLCSAVELHLTRAVAADLAAGRGTTDVAGTGHRQTVGLLGVALLLTLVSAPLLDEVFGGDVVLTVLLATSLPGMAFSYGLRGRLAGEQRYGRYSLTFAVEAATTAVVGAVLLALGETSPRWWVLAFVLGPAVAVVVTLLLPRLPVHPGTDGPSAARVTRGLVLSVVVLGCSQAVWNLGPVILTARLTDVPAVAAGFAAVAVVLRIPVLVFPAAQALLLPVLTARERDHRGLVRAVPARWWTAVAVLAGAWLVVAAVLVPPAVTLAFGAEHLPGTVSLLLLAAATLVGGAAQLVQTSLVARSDYVLPAAGWATALVVLVLVGVLAPAGVAASSWGLFAAVLVALVAFTLPRPVRTPDRSPA